MSSSKDLLKLENEYRNEIPKYKEKPNIKCIAKPSFLTDRVAKFLAKSEQQKEISTNSVPDDSPMQSDEQQSSEDTAQSDTLVEMDIYIAEQE